MDDVERAQAREEAAVTAPIEADHPEYEDAPEEVVDAGVVEDEEAPPPPLDMGRGCELMVQLAARGYDLSLRVETQTSTFTGATRREWTLAVKAADAGAIAEVVNLAEGQDPPLRVKTGYQELVIY